ncbi:type IX secretion system membrane protein PorP/SprF [uncultured Croceitalea sp.]|uniref:PorP/SprF family type IX secretion system membrane protein n=1 Tax=uncultured Croceitalea sp. TaxID=1798908 RepID=UPI0033067FC4
MKRLLSLMIFALFFCAESNAQEGIPVYFDYLSDNYYLVYPSMAGIGEGGKLRLTARKQWFDVENAPALQTFNANFRVGQNSGIGGILFNDANGFHSQSGFKGTYAHHLQLGGDFRTLNQLSFGLSGTILLSSLDETEFRSVNPDPAVSGVKNTASYFNIDLGVSYNYFEFYTHFTVQNVLATQRNLYRIGRADPDNVPVIDNLRRYLISAGYVFGKGRTRIEPSVLFQLTEFTEEKSVDINAKAYRDLGDDTTIWGGLSYRRSFDGAQFVQNGTFGEQRLQLFTPIVGVNYKNFLFSYNYSYQSGDIRFDSGGFHQITLGYDFGQSNEKRYDCYCPAANN